MDNHLLEISLQLFRYILPLIIISGTVGNLLNIIVLTRPIFLLKSCSFYFLLFSINNLFYSSIILLSRLLSIGYKLSPNTSSRVLCKLIQYFNDVSPAIPPYFLVLASFDRYCNSSTNIRLRKFNQISVARWTSGITIFLFLIFYLHTLLFADLREDDGLGCRIRGDSIYKQIYIIIQFLLLVFISPFLMGLFGLMTVYNIKHLRIIPLSIFQQRRIEIQLIRMVLYQVIIYIILIFPLGIAYLMILLPTVYSRMKNFYGVYTLCYLPFYLAYGTSFFLHVLVDRLYRKVFIRMIRTIFSCCHRV